MENTTETKPLTEQLPESPLLEHHGLGIPKILIIAFILPLIVAIGFSLYLLAQTFNTHSDTVGPSKPAAIAKVTPTPTINPVANWKKYENVKYNFSFSYPDTDGLVLNENTKSINKLSPQSLYEVTLSYPNSDQVLSFIVFPNPKELSAQDWWEANYNTYFRNQKSHIDGAPLLQKDFNLSKKKFGNNKLLFAENSQLFASPYFLSNDIYMIEIISSLPQAVTTQILSTFKSEVPTPTGNLSKVTPTTTGKDVICTLEAKLCPDGTYVSRTGPNCEFAACPK